MITLDLLLRNARIVDVFLLRTYHGWVGIRDGRFVYVEPGDPPDELPAAVVRDMQGAFIAPGLIDSHMHIESSLITPRRFAEAVIPYGTTTVLADPHEVGNVAGEAGVRWMIQAAAHLPLRVYHSIPSCVPATSPDLEWTAQVFGPDVIDSLGDEEAVIALGEVMDYMGLIDSNSRLKDIVAAARAKGLLLEGHIPTLRGMELSEYLSHGIASDHTLTDPGKIREQISKGLAVMLQTKSLTPDNMAAVADLPDRSRIILVTDDIEPTLLQDGHLSRMILLAIQAGMPVLEAFAAATCRPARYLNLRDLGAIAPGYRADFMIMDDLEQFPPQEVFVSGQRFALNGAYQVDELPALPPVPASFGVPGPLSREDFRIDPSGQSYSSVVANAVVIQNRTNSLTKLEQIPLQIEDGYAVFEDGDDLALVGVFTRNRSSHTIGVIKHVGLSAGGFASSLAHDSHNLLVIGRDIDSMQRAAQAVYEMGGGVAVATRDELLASLPLPIFGLLSDKPVPAVAKDLSAVSAALRELGMDHTRPFLLLSVLALSVSPYVKFTDKGVVDTEKRVILEPWMSG